MPEQTESRALAPDALTKLNRRHLILTLDGEDANSTYAQILAPAFWAEFADQLNDSDIVTVLRPDAPAIDLLVGQRHPDGGLRVDDCAVYGCPVPPLPGENAAKPATIKAHAAPTPTAPTRQPADVVRMVAR